MGLAPPQLSHACVLYDRPRVTLVPHTHRPCGELFWLSDASITGLSQIRAWENLYEDQCSRHWLPFTTRASPVHRIGVPPPLVALRSTVLRLSHPPERLRLGWQFSHNPAVNSGPARVDSHASTLRCQAKPSPRNTCEVRSSHDPAVRPTGLDAVQADPTYTACCWPAMSRFSLQLGCTLLSTRVVARSRV